MVDRLGLRGALMSQIPSSKWRVRARRRLKRVARVVMVGTGWFQHHDRVSASNLVAAQSKTEHRSRSHSWSGLHVNVHVHVGC
ncbi:hypothetical protein BDW74DRAFT_164087 [Aspergillus multicolor]|uniref:uncharacterized protein n=1 Tax=Aspergillus multicolor TaxID=41759 RepID=UPI003CCD6023